MLKKFVPRTRKTSKGLAVCYVGLTFYSYLGKFGDKDVQLLRMHLTRYLARAIIKESMIH